MPAKRWNFHKAPRASDTTEGPVEPSVEEQTRPMEAESTVPEENEAERPVEGEVTVPLVVVPPEEATASSPPTGEPREEEHNFTDFAYDIRKIRSIYQNERLEKRSSILKRPQILFTR